MKKTLYAPWLWSVLETGLPALCTALAVTTAAPVWASDRDYNSAIYGGSSYAQHGPGPAYGSGYANYGMIAVQPRGGFNASYGEYHAVPGYGRFRPGSLFDSGPFPVRKTGRRSAALTKH